MIRILTAWLIYLLAGAAVAQGLGSGDVRLSPGDVVKLKVFGQPDLSDLYEIGPDGALTVPGLGRIPEVDSLSVVQDGIGRLIAENFGVRDNSYAVTISRLRPITVGGDVASPGEVPYTLGLRVAQAVALAGGPRRALSSDQFSRVVQLNQERERLGLAQTRLARALITKARLQAELNGSPAFEAPQEAIDLIGAERAARLVEIETDIALSNLNSNVISNNRIVAATEITENDIAAQRSSRQSLEQQLELVRDDLLRLQPLIERQAITGDRILALRRDIAQIEGFVGQAVATLAQSETEQAILAEEDEALELNRQVTILAQLLAVEAEIMDASSSLLAIETTLDEAGELPITNDRNGTRPGSCRVAILRSGPDGAPGILDADVLTPLNPGDHVEVGPVTRDCDSPFF